jgi:hypothetical protein
MERLMARKPLSAGGRRAKGIRGENEVTKLFTKAGFAMRGLENQGDHIATRGKPGGLLALHVETKRQERVRVPEWLRQCKNETPPGMVPVVCFRQSGEEWTAALPLKTLLELLNG